MTSLVIAANSVTGERAGTLLRLRLLVHVTRSLCIRFRRFAIIQANARRVCKCGNYVSNLIAGDSDSDLHCYKYDDDDDDDNDDAITGGL